VAPPKPRPAYPFLPDGEDSAIERIGDYMRSVSGLPPRGQIWIGDDAAVVPAPSGPLVLATDSVVAGVHADLSLVGVDDLGWKAVTAAVSDIGAMGARPLQALVTLCVPPGTDLDTLVAGVAEASAEWTCTVVGGDLSTAGQVVVSVAVTGALEGALPAVTRGGASPGDSLFVTGTLGASAAGLRILRERTGGVLRGRRPPVAETAALVDAHRRPRARLAEGQVARLAGARAMIDVSDGLSIDMYRLAGASKVGFQLDVVPVAAGATLPEALGGGEDYELVIATPDPEGLMAAFAATGLRAPVPIGRCTADPLERVLDREPLPRLGWQHPIT